MAEEKVMRIRELRQLAGLSDKELADRLGVVRTTVCNWEQEYSLPNPRQLPQLAAALGVSIDALFTEQIREVTS